MKKTIRSYDLNNKRVIIRCDLNVSIKDGKIVDDSKIVASLNTIRYATSNNARVILMSHLGKVKCEEDKDKNSLLVVANRLSELLEKDILFCPVTRGSELEEMVNSLKPRDVLLIENTRYEDYPNKLESGNDVELAKYWASLGDIYINDAYGTAHRKHASNVGIAKFLPSGMGLLMELEVNKIDQIIKEDTHPFIVIMGGKKVEDKLKLITKMLNICDKVLIGGAMAFTFLKAKGYNVGKSIVNDDEISRCKELLNNENLVLPVDVIVDNNGNISCKNIEDIEDNDIGYDIGNLTIKLFNDYISSSKRIVMNGPMGMFENNNFQNGTKEIYKTIIDNKIRCLVGGGDSLTSLKMLNIDSSKLIISTGGGATLTYLEGGEMPGISVLNEEK
ncbi:MAG: phosphoglycerate kinase [bacterium]|nr:phosphoglycerate kinase [bacterium]